MLYFILLLLIMLFSLLHNSNQLHHSSKTMKEWFQYSSHYNDVIHILLQKDMLQEYQITVNINRTDCINKVHNRTTIEHFIEREIGYDEIVIDIVGDNLLSFLGKYAFCGTYHKTFTISKSGFYEITVSIFSSFNNISTNMNDILLKEGIFLNQSMTIFCPKHTNGLWTRYNSSTLNLSLFPSSSSSSSSSTCMDYAEHYYWDAGHGCGFSSITPTKASVILSNLTIYCLGNSRISYFCSLLLKWACEINSDLNKDVNIPSNSHLCPNLNISYTKDEECNTLSNSKSDRIILFNCGHSSNNLEKFKSSVEFISTSVSKSSLWLWLEIAPLILDNENDSLRVIDMKNRYAIQHFAKFNKKINIIPTFHSLLPFHKECSNANHNDNQSLLVPIYEEILRHLNKIKENV